MDSPDPTSPDPISSQRRFNTKLGLILFAIYMVLYLGFVLINAFAADWTETIVLAGLNLAIVYGFGLIAAALIMALFYGLLCRNEPIPPAEGSDDGKGDVK